MTAKPENEVTLPLRDELQILITQTTALDQVVSRQTADAITHLLNERGHYLPGCPPATQILKDAEQFAGQFMIATLCVRLLRMLNTRIKTPERKGMERWLNDYVDGKNHGPVGKPMLWPGGLPGLSTQLRQWGYAPTPTRPEFVGRQILGPPVPSIN